MNPLIRGVFLFFLMTTNGANGKSLIETVCTVATKLTGAYEYLYIIMIKLDSCFICNFKVVSQIIHFGPGNAAPIPMDPRTVVSN